MSPPRPESPEQVAEAVRATPRLRPRGGGSKPALSSAPDGAESLDLSALRGVLEYDPGEFTLTALAGTPVAEIDALLAEQGQYLPFDPLLVAEGATLGGTVAAASEGPGRLRYGGLRDFLLGVRMVDGRGTLFRGGGKVVKNAAGFDIPKFVVGSLGTLGVLVEVTFKVFPRATTRRTLLVTCGSVAEGLARLTRLATSAIALETAELSGDGRLWLRIGGHERAIEERLGALRALVGDGHVLEGEDEQALWRAARELDWAPEGAMLAKIPVTPDRIPMLDRVLGGAEVRYGAAGQVAWVAWEGAPADLGARLAPVEMTGMVVRAPEPGARLIGRVEEHALARRVRGALDPDGRFV